MRKILCLLLPLLGVPLCAKGQATTRPADSVHWEIVWKWKEVSAGKPRVVQFKKNLNAANIRITQKDGLGSNVVRSITQLKDGTMVFGTDHGLSILQDGAIKTYTGPEYFGPREQQIPGNSGLPGNEINDLLVSKDGALWIATGNGLCRIRNGKWQILQASVKTNDKFAGMRLEFSLNDTQKIFQAGNGKIVLGCRADSVTVIDPDSDKARTVYHDPKSTGPFSSITEDKRGNLWLATDGHLLHYDWKSCKPYSSKESWIPGGRIASVLVDASGNLWLGGEKGLSLKPFAGPPRMFKESDVLPANTPLRLYSRKNGELWVLTWDGLAVFDGKKWKYPITSRQNFCPNLALFEDKDSRMWIGEWPGAIRQSNIRFTYRNPRLVRIEEFKKHIEKSYPTIQPHRELAVDRANRVYGYVSDKLLRYDGKKWEDLSRLLEKSGVYFLKSDSKGRVWVGSSEGCGLIGFDGDKVLRYNHDVPGPASIIYDMAEDSKGRLYLGTQDGLWRLVDGQIENLTRKYKKLDSVPRYYLTQQPHPVICDKQDRVWFADVNHGLFMYAGGKLIHLSAEGPLKGRRIRNLTLDKSGRVRVSTITYTAKAMEHLTFLHDGKNCMLIKEDPSK
ncbi:MAG: hypothetical protein KAV00_01155 [Phycisphaerae bacterium]|nr:hypothetical protein [Phycisphaerae bacterium]